MHSLQCQLHVICMDQLPDRDNNVPFVSAQTLVVTIRTDSPRQVENAGTQLGDRWYPKKGVARAKKCKRITRFFFS